MGTMRNIFGGGGGFFGGGGPLGALGNIAELFSKFRQFAANPIGALTSINVGIPQNLQGNYKGMVDYLRSSGRMTPDQYEQISQTANQVKDLFGQKF